MVLRARGRFHSPIVVKSLQSRLRYCRGRGAMARRHTKSRCRSTWQAARSGYSRARGPHGPALVSPRSRAGESSSVTRADPPWVGCRSLLRGGAQVAACGGRQRAAPFLAYGRGMPISIAVGIAGRNFPCHAWRSIGFPCHDFGVLCARSCAPMSAGGMAESVSLDSRCGN
jgi:hypothetical protein